MKKVAVIGGGVIGLCTAYYATLRGHEVTVLDRNAEDHPGCSHGNAGMIVPSHIVPLAAPGAVALGLKWMWNPESPFWIKPRADLELLNWGLKFWKASTPEHVERAAPVLRDLHLASRSCFEELQSEFEFSLARRGLLMLCKSEEALAHEAASAEQSVEHGIPAEVLTAKQTAELDPGVHMDVAGAVYFPKDCHLDPGQFMRGLKEKLRKLGVKFLFRTEVREFKTRGGALLSVGDGTAEFAADEFVLCGGVWSAGIARELSLSIPMQAGKGYSLTLERPRELPGICAILAEARVAVTPIGRRLRFGGTMEMAGLNEEINAVRVKGIIKAVPKYYPAFQQEDFEGVQPWRGLRPCSPDGLPYLGRTAKFSNLVIATGHAMMGLSLGPVTGKLAAEMFSGERPSIDTSILNPDRYA